MVARLAGLPVPVLKRAKEVLRQLEEEQLDDIRPSRGLARAKQKKEKGERGAARTRFVWPGRGSRTVAATLAVVTLVDSTRR